MTSTDIYTIYRHTSPSGKSYIGVTKRGIDNRFHGHVTLANKTKRTKFHKAIVKYGEDNFISEELFYTTEKEFAYEMEIYYIDLFDTHKNGYNGTDGGEHGPVMIGKDNPMYGKTHTEEVKDIISKTHTGKILTKNTKQKMSIAKSGKNHPNWNKNLSEETKNKIGDGNRGKTISSESRKKMSESHKKMEKFTCPHCGFSCKYANAVQWHFDKCKKKIILY